MSKKLVDELQEKEKQDQADFDAAWVEDGSPQVPKEKDTSEEDPVPPETKADEVPAQDSQQGDRPNEDPIPAPGAARKEETDEAKQLREELEKERQRTRSWEGRIRAANNRAKELEDELLKIKDVRDTRKESPPKDPEDPDEDAAVKAFREEFPDLPKPIIALVKKELMPVVRGMVQAELAKIDPVVKEVETIRKHIEIDTTDAHLKAITDAHKDWESIVSSGELQTFIDSQPSFVRKALEQVKAQGETQEVIDMFSQYKDWKQKTKPTKPNTPTERPKEDLSEELAVPASPGGPRIPKHVDKNDFDAAWDEANKQG